MAYEWFISYRRKTGGENQAAQVAEILSKYVGKDKVFYDRESMHEGNDWSEQIDAALDTAKHFVLLVNEASAAKDQSNNIGGYRYEIETALKLNKKITLIEYNKESYDEVIAKYPSFKNVQRVTFNGEYNFAFEERLCKHFGFNYKAESTSVTTVIKNITIPENLVPRRDMLDKLCNEFKSHQCVVISGIGGSGKTSLAYLYAKEQNFNNVAWIIVNGNIEDAFVSEMTIQLYKDENERSYFIQNYNKQEKLKILTNKLSDIQGKNLLVLDINTNNEEIKQEIETKIHNYLLSDNWKTLVLTRVPAEKPSRFATIKVDKMTTDDAKELFLKNWTRTTIVFSEEQLAEITKELYYHPLLIEQTAIVFSQGLEKNADKIITKIKANSKIDNPRTKKILSSLTIEDKDQQDIYTYLINLCNIEKLSANEIKFLAVYVTWPEEPIDYYDVIEVLLPDSEDTLASLVKKGILSRNKDQFSIHSLMADVVREQINIKDFDYTEYLDNIQKCLSVVLKVSLHQYSKCITSSLINYGICSDDVLLEKYIIQLMNGRVTYYYTFGTECSCIIQDLIDNLTNKYNDSDAETNLEKDLEMISKFEENDENLYMICALHIVISQLKSRSANKLKSARQHLQKVVEIKKKLINDPNYKESLAIGLSNLSGIENYIGNYDSAKKTLKESIEIVKNLPNTKENLQWLANSLYGLGLICIRTGDLNSAKKNYQEVLDISTQIQDTYAITRTKEVLKLLDSNDKKNESVPEKKVSRWFCLPSKSEPNNIEMEWGKVSIRHFDR